MSGERAEQLGSTSILSPGLPSMTRLFSSSSICCFFDVTYCDAEFLESFVEVKFLEEPFFGGSCGWSICISIDGCWIAGR